MQVRENRGKLMVTHWLYSGLTQIYCLPQTLGLCNGTIVQSAVDNEHLWVVGTSKSLLYFTFTLKTDGHGRYNILILDKLNEQVAERLTDHIHVEEHLKLPRLSPLFRVPSLKLLELAGPKTLGVLTKMCRFESVILKNESEIQWIAWLKVNG